MRFIEHGPDIPDELLLDLDEGRVVFFCGAGVSCENAQLPHFKGLAQEVLRELRVSNKHPAYKIFNEISKIGVSGLISTDRIFGELEKSLSSEIIHAAVAKALCPKKNVILKAHKTLLKLATTKTGHTRIVTTNFDRLFEKCDKNLQAWQRSHLPADLTQFEGLVYLHGRVNEDYSGSDEGFILSSAEFGLAYLAQGWATQFFKDIISKYTVIFIGYGAEDPPVYYLLEAINKTNSNAKKMYAFQSGHPEKASARWQHKGVTAISYTSSKLLWKTLSAWAERAQNLEVWQDCIIKMAQNEPETLSPFQREQVAHLVSTQKGAQRFCEDDNPPPATWLCVFDPAIRFEKPTTITQKDGTEYPVDYFSMYGLASDPAPKSIDPNNDFSSREVPSETWSAFAVNTEDGREVQDNSLAPMKGVQALAVKNLPSRLYALGVWIAKVSDQNAAVWWAVKQQNMYEWVQNNVRTSLRNKTACPPHIVRIWHYLFDSWNLKSSDLGIHQQGWYVLKSDLTKFGWDAAMVRRYEELAKPRMTICSQFWQNAIPPKKHIKTDFMQMAQLKVSYNDYLDDIHILDEWLVEVVAALKRNLDIAVRLEKDKDYFPFMTIAPITPSDDPNINSYQRTHGLSNMVLHYVSLFKRLLELNPQQAKSEIKTWDKEDDNVYARLRVWSARFVEVVADDDVAVFLSLISRNAFWYSSHERDLLHTLKARWAEMPDATKRDITKRILQGPEKREREKKNEYPKRRDAFILQLFDWLKNNGCVLSADVDKKIAQLKKLNPEYNEEYAKEADSSFEVRGGWVRTDTEYSVLLDLPRSDILAKAEEEMGRRDDFLTEYDPFGGLCEARPALAIVTLRHEAKQGIYRAWAWRKFLYHQKRKDDPDRLKRLIAEMLVHLHDETAVEIMPAATNWLLSASKKLPLVCVPIFETLTKRLIKIMHDNHQHEYFKTETENRDYDWGFQAINSSTGHLAEALFHDPRLKGLKVNQSPPPNWINIAKDMLNLPNDFGRYALLIFMYRMDWFYDVNPQWAHNNLLQPLFDNNPDTVEAWWAGYRWGVPDFDIFQKIKPYLLARASNQDIKKRNGNDIMQHLILLNWAHNDTDKERISDDEFHDVLLNVEDDFRVRVLWQIEWLCKQDELQLDWKNKRNHLLEKVWPLEIQAKTPHTSKRLIELAFSNKTDFPHLSTVILNLLGEIKRPEFLLFLDEEDNAHIIDAYPKSVLEILYQVLPQNANDWPYKIENVIERIATTEGALKQHDHFKELSLRWTTR